MNYTEKQTEEILARYEAAPSRETVDALSVEFSKSPRSVIAKLASAGVYKTPERTTKAGEVIEKKEDMVIQICTWLGIEMPTLVKTGKLDLKRLRDSLQDLIGELDYE